MFEHFGKHDCNKVEHDKKMKQDHYYVVIGGNNPGVYPSHKQASKQCNSGGHYKVLPDYESSVIYFNDHHYD